MKRLKFLAIALVGLFIASVAPVASAAPGAAAKLEIRKAVAYADQAYVADQINYQASATVGVIPAKLPSVPKTRVYLTSKYRGMLIAHDISRRYDQVNITFKCSPYNFNAHIPPTFS